MIQAALSMAAMAVLFVIFGALRIGAGKGCGGSCGSCEHDCEIDLEGRQP